MPTSVKTCGHPSPPPSFIFSSEAELVTRNANGEFEFAFDNEYAHTLVEKMDKLLRSPDTLVYASQWAKSEQERFADNMFVDISKGRSLFNVNNIAMLYLYRDSDLNFGVLPYPKLRENQDGYYTNDWSGLMCVPKTVQNDDMVGKVIELLSYYSDDVRYAYYDLVLGEKLTRDKESKEMLDIIFDGVSYNAGVNYFGFSDMYKIFYFPHWLIMIGNGYNGFASHLATYQPATEATIAQFNADVAALNTAE